MPGAPIDADVLVAGGGIAGVSAALARAGRHVQVIERAATFGEIGAGLQIDPNAVGALDQLGDRYFRARRDDDYAELDWLYARPDTELMPAGARDHAAR